jgi:uncharacterized protein (TIGR02996 family)
MPALKACRRSIIPMDEETFFLNGIRANPEDHFLRLVYADWLEERGDGPRSEYLRVDGELQKMMASIAPNKLATDVTIRRLGARLKKLGKTLDTAWVAIFDALRPKFFRCRACRKVLTEKEAIDTNPRSYRKMKSSRYCTLCYEDAVRSQLRRGIDQSFGKYPFVEHDDHDDE